MAGCFTGLWDLHQIKPLQRSELLLRLWPTKQHHAAFKAENWDTLNGKPQWERGTAGVCFVLFQGSGSMIIRILLDTELNCTKLRWSKATWSHASRTGYNIYWAIRHSVPFSDLMPSSPFFQANWSRGCLQTRFSSVTRIPNKGKNSKVITCHCFIVRMRR